MAEQNLQFNITAKNQATAEVAKVSDGIKKANTEVAKAQKQFSGMWAEVAKGNIAFNLINKAISGATDFIKGSVQASMEASAAMQQVQTNVNNAGFSYKELTGTIAEVQKRMIALGFDDEDASIAFSKLLQVTGDVSQANKDLSLAADLARYKNIGLEESTQMLILAQNGNARALKAMGVEVSATATKQEILDAIQKRVANSADAYSKTMKGQFDVLKVNMGNLQETVGDTINVFLAKLLPTINKVVSKITDIVTAISKFVYVNGDAIVQVGAIVSIALTALAVFLNWEKIVKTVTAAQALLNAVMIANPIGIIVTIIGALIIAFGYLVIRLGGVQQAFKAVWLGILIATNAFVGGMKELLNGLVIGPLNFILSGVNNLANAFIDVFNLFAKGGEKMQKMDLKIPELSTTQQSANIKGYVAELQKLDATAKEVKKTKTDAYNAGIKESADMIAKEKAQANETGKSASKITEALDKMKAGYQDLASKAKDSLQTISDKVNDLNDQKFQLSVDYGNTKNESINSLAEEYVKQQQKIKDSNKDVADTANAKMDWEKEQETAIAELKAKLNSETDADTQASLKKELDDKQTTYEKEKAIKFKELQDKNNQLATEMRALEAHKDISIQYANQVAEAQRVAGLTDFERAVEDIAKKKALADQEYADKVTKINDELAMEQTKKDTIVALLQSANDSYIAMMKNRSAVTEATIQKEIDSFSNLAKVIADVQSAKSTAGISTATTGVATTGSTSSTSTVSAKTSWTPPTGYEKISGPSQISKYTGVITEPGTVNLWGKKIPGKYTGGNVSSNQAYIVGEKGPEMFRPNVSGSITPNNKMGSGANITLNLTVNGNADKQQARDVANMIMKELKMVVNI